MRDVEHSDYGLLMFSNFLSRFRILQVFGVMSFILESWH
jgi:hypothetical protein